MESSHRHLKYTAKEICFPPCIIRSKISSVNLTYLGLKSLKVEFPCSCQKCSSQGERFSIWLVPLSVGPAAPHLPANPMKSFNKLIISSCSNQRATNPPVTIWPAFHNLFLVHSAPESNIYIAWHGIWCPLSLGSENTWLITCYWAHLSKSGECLTISHVLRHRILPSPMGWVRGHHNTPKINTSSDLHLNI